MTKKNCCELVSCPKYLNYKKIKIVQIESSLSTHMDADW